MKKLFSAIAAIVATAGLSMALAAPAGAANETATANLTMTPQNGKLFKQAHKPVNWRLDVEVKAPWPASPKVLPMKQVSIDFPKDMKFVPKKNTPVCPNSQIGPPPVNLNVDPNTAIARCPGAVLGNGTAGLYLAQNNSAVGPNLTDPELVVFNGGRTGNGLPKVKIYGYSKGTGAGIYMEGVLRGGNLTISIPVLTFDSAVGDFNLNIPGTNNPNANRRGKDRTYVQTKCSSGTWQTTARFTLGTRDTAGNPTSLDSTVVAPTDTTNCVGLNGRANLKVQKVKGPKKLKRGQTKAYRVRVKNRGTRVAQGMNIAVRGKWVKNRKQRVGKLAPGQAKTFKVRAGINRKAKKGKRTVIKFRTNAKQTKAVVGKARVRVR
jgi:hypothetical protein